MEQDWHARGDEAQNERMRDWLESQTFVIGFWMDRLAEKGDIRLLTRLADHRQHLQGLIGDLEQVKA
ncbi:MAG: hypothetical protein CMK09_16860 [Ponticaulis sp.]|nr:hypothetical protein [Ponticaulis sp.]|tara:strand:+ start:39934 stop:40134 length:201 start_codon:yes stop_codon:yes gene_type:complete